MGKDSQRWRTRSLQATLAPHPSFHRSQKYLLSTVQHLFLALLPSPFTNNAFQRLLTTACSPPVAITQLGCTAGSIITQPSPNSPACHPRRMLSSPATVCLPCEPLPQPTPSFNHYITSFRLSFPATPRAQTLEPSGNLPASIPNPPTGTHFFSLPSLPPFGASKVHPAPYPR